MRTAAINLLNFVIYKLFCMPSGARMMPLSIKMNAWIYSEYISSYFLKKMSGLLNTPNICAHLYAFPILLYGMCFYF